MINQGNSACFRDQLPGYPSEPAGYAPCNGQTVYHRLNDYWQPWRTGISSPGDSCLVWRPCLQPRDRGQRTGSGRSTQNHPGFDLPGSAPGTSRNVFYFSWIDSPGIEKYRVGTNNREGLFHWIQQEHYEKIMLKTRSSEPELKDAISEIQKLNPKPEFRSAIFHAR